MIRNVRQLTFVSLSLLGAACVTACGTHGVNDDPDGENQPDATGSVDLRLTLANGDKLTSAAYTITGPKGYTKTGSIDVSKSSKIIASIGGIPGGDGYSISISAVSSNGNSNCAGSASFDVLAGKKVTVNVPVLCHERSRTGTVLVNGTINVCPTIDGLDASPAEVVVGGSIALGVTAHDSDAAPEAMSYAWAASGGTLSSSSDREPTLTCTEEGPITVTLVVSDGDTDESCAATSSVEVTCTVAEDVPGTYLTGDFHNHTTCSDGAISMQKLVKKSMKDDSPWGLDWFVQAGHGGSGNRNCTLVEDESLSTPAYPYVAGSGPSTTWVNSGITPKGDNSGSGANRNMWRWQALQEFQYPVMEYLNVLKDLPLFLGLESVVAGHEHTSMAVITGQIPAGLEAEALPTSSPYEPVGNADALSQWTYCFDRGVGDTSRGAENQWDCSVPGSPNEAHPDWNDSAKKLVPAGGTGTGDRGHNKTVEAIKWMAAYHPDGSYYVPAHLERAGQFNPNGNNGFNVEHLRNFNNAGPRIAFGMETQPGHGASDNRGEYGVLRNNIGGVRTDSVGGTTYGGTGVYGAQVGGVWDALLGEGRNWWFFASSDWHNRGSFGPDDRRTTQDFYPGEYQRNFTMVKSASSKPTPQEIVDGLRSGDNYATSGQIIDRLAFTVCAGKSEGVVSQLVSNAAMNGKAVVTDGCVSMGDKLVIDAGTDIVIGIAVRDPAGANYSPYTFLNPSLLQVGIEQPLDRPVLDHIDVIGGLVTGYRTPGTPEYSGAWPVNTDWLKPDGTTPADLSGVPEGAKNTSAAIVRTFNGAGSGAWESVSSHVDGSDYLVMTMRIPAVAASQYLRLRGTNLPAAVPYETDASGNPLADVYTNETDRARLMIPCTTSPSEGSQFDGCPDHLPTATGASPIAGQRAVAFDIAAWADLWFYSNPIYVEVNGSYVVAGVN